MPQEQNQSAANLYSAPKARLEVFADQGTDLWRDGKVLVCRRDAVFPGRCVKCNEPAESEAVSYKLAWHHAGWYVLIFLNIVIYAIVAMIVRKSATLEVGLCESHRRKRTLARVLGWAGLAVIIAGISIGLATDQAWLIAVGFLGILPLILVAMLLSPRLIAARIDKEVVRVRGCGRDFLDTLPEYTD